MAYCTQCGQKLEEGEIHDCPARIQQEQNQINTSKLETGTIKGLIKNPLMGLQLNEQSSSIYGWVGIGAAILGVFLWALSIFNSINRGLDGIPFINSSIKPNYFILLLIGLFSIGLLILSIHFTSNWLGSEKKNFKQAMTTLGATQWSISLLFVIIIVLAFIDVFISTILFYTIFIIDIALLLVVSIDFYKVDNKKRLPVIGLSIVAYLLVNGLILKLMIGEMIRSFSIFGGGF